MIGKGESILEGKSLTWKFNDYEVEFSISLQIK